jgi:hypothetical protein
LTKKIIPIMRCGHNSDIILNGKPACSKCLLYLPEDVNKPREAYCLVCGEVVTSYGGLNKYIYQSDLDYDIFKHEKC